MKKKTSPKRSTASTKPVASKRTRLTGVRGRVLDLLANGPMTASALVSAGGFSAAALYLNIKALKAEQLINAEGSGREISYSLSMPAAVTSKKTRMGRMASSVTQTLPAALPTIPASVLVAYIPDDLTVALNGLSDRLAPIERLSEKLRVLEHLVATLPGPIAAVLSSIARDLKRISPTANGELPV